MQARIKLDKKMLNQSIQSRNKSYKNNEINVKEVWIEKLKDDLRGLMLRRNIPQRNDKIYRENLQYMS